MVFISKTKTLTNSIKGLRFCIISLLAMPGTLSTLNSTSPLYRFQGKQTDRKRKMKMHRKMSLKNYYAITMR